jgi:hypothetical protein
MTLDNSHIKDKVSPSSSNAKKRRSQSMSGMASLDGGDAGAAAGEEGVRGAAAITLALGMAGELISPRSECALRWTLFTGIAHAEYICNPASTIAQRSRERVS